MTPDILGEILIKIANKKLTSLRNLYIENNNKSIKIFWDKEAYTKNEWTMKVNKATGGVNLNSKPTGHVSDVISIISDWYANNDIEDWYYGP